MSLRMAFGLVPFPFLFFTLSSSQGFPYGRASIYLSLQGWQVDVFWEVLRPNSVSTALLDLVFFFPLLLVILSEGCERGRATWQVFFMSSTKAFGLSKKDLVVQATPCLNLQTYISLRCGTSIIQMLKLVLYSVMFRQHQIQSNKQSHDFRCKKYNNFRYSSIEWLLTALVIDNEEAFSQKKNFPWYDSIIWQVSNT